MWVVASAVGCCVTLVEKCQHKIVIYFVLFTVLQVALGDSGLVVKGVFQRVAVGYLSHLEALRYCEVSVRVCA